MVDGDEWVAGGWWWTVVPWPAAPWFPQRGPGVGIGGKKKRNSGGRGHPWARLTVGFGEASHRDWLETQACCWAHQKQGHCADRQLVQLKDRGPPLSCWLPIKSLLQLPSSEALILWPAA